MTRETVNGVPAFIRASGVTKLNVTGGASELNPHFRDLSWEAQDLKMHVMDRRNLTLRVCSPHHFGGHARHMETALFCGSQIHFTAFRHVHVMAK
jgi:hypothetical protein